jgi:RND family efflux transporter MFP subunit
VNWKLTLILCAAIIAVVAGLLALIFSTEPEAVPGGATKRTAMLVEVTTAEEGTFRPRIAATGTVIPEREIHLSPLVGGEVIEVADAFEPGGRVAAGDVLLRIDPADYRATLQERRSALRQAEADRDIEQGRQEVAQQDYALLEDSLGPENRSLVLREPQLAMAEARVEAARAQVRQAELDLRRTTIRAPFDALVLSREANLGSLVSPGEPAGRLVGLEAYWVETTVPVSRLPWIRFPGGGAAGGSAVTVRNRSAWPDAVYREGRLARLVGELDTTTRMARVLVRVPDPLGPDPERVDKPPLILGSFLQVAIEGKPIESALRLPRDLVRQNDTVWVKADGVLDIREVDIVFRDREYAYIRDGLDADEQVVVTNLATVLQGAPLRVEGEEE